MVSFHASLTHPLLSISSKSICIEKKRSKTVGSSEVLWIAGFTCFPKLPTFRQHVRQPSVPVVIHQEFGRFAQRIRGTLDSGIRGCSELFLARIKSVPEFRILRASPNSIHHQHHVIFGYALSPKRKWSENGTQLFFDERTKKSCVPFSLKARHGLRIGP